MPKLHISHSRTGRLLITITGVLTPVALTSLETTSGSNIVNVASTTGLFPGMSVHAPNVPPGSIVHAVISATKLELWRSAWNATTGVYSHSAANAQATASTSTPVLGYALSFDPLAPVLNTYIEGKWRNLHSKENKLMSWVSGSAVGTGVSAGPGTMLMPSAVTITNGLGTMTAGSIISSDDLAATPLKRDDGEPHTLLLVVHTGGMLSVIHEPHTKDITYYGAD